MREHRSGTLHGFTVGLPELVAVLVTIALLVAVVVVLLNWRGRS